MGDVFTSRLKFLASTRILGTLCKTREN